MSDWNDARDHRGHSSSRGTACRVARLPGIGSVAIERALRRTRHRILRRRRAAKILPPAARNSFADMAVRLGDHASAKAAAELDFTAGFVSKDVLHQERNTAKRPVSQRPFIEILNPIGIPFDDRAKRPGLTTSIARYAVSASSFAETWPLRTNPARPIHRRWNTLQVSFLKDRRLRRCGYRVRRRHRVRPAPPDSRRSGARTARPARCRTRL